MVQVLSLEQLVVCLTLLSKVLYASGGAEPETIESIKYYAPLNYSAQRRLVTTSDYKSILPEIYPNIKSIQVWWRIMIHQSMDSVYCNQSIVWCKTNSGSERIYC